MVEERFVLDASALLALLFREAGAARVEAVLDRAMIGVANYAEVVAKLADRGVSLDTIAPDLFELDLAVVPDDRSLAEAAARIGAGPQRSGLAVADRLCLELARRAGATVLTADRGWPTIGAAIGVAVEVLDTAVSA